MIFEFRDVWYGLYRGYVFDLKSFEKVEIIKVSFFKFFLVFIWVFLNSVVFKIVSLFYNV